jgi:hypothetical protein
MKRTLYVTAAALVIAMGTCASAQESLGDVARQQRQSKRPSTAKVYTNDDFAVVPPPAPAAAAAPGDAAKAEKSEKDKNTGAEDKAKLAASIKSKIDEQKKNIAQLERELDVAQREYRLKVAVYYSDVGNNLRDSKKWTEDDRKQRTEIEGKQKSLDDAKQKLADLQEQARKADVRAE